MTDAPRQDAPDAEPDFEAAERFAKATIADEWIMQWQESVPSLARAYLALRERVPSEPINACPDSCECDGSCEPPALAPHAPEPVAWTEEQKAKAVERMHNTLESRFSENARIHFGQTHEQWRSWLRVLLEAALHTPATPPQRAGVTEPTEEMVDAADATFLSHGIDDLRRAVQTGAYVSDPELTHRLRRERMRAALLAASRVAPQGGET